MKHAYRFLLPFFFSLIILVLLQQSKVYAQHLISPANKAIVNAQKSIVFTWKPPLVTVRSNNTIKLKIVEIAGNQSPSDAIKQNKAWFEMDGIKGTTFNYPASAKKFNEGKNYAWQVSWGDLKSEVFMFMIHVIDPGGCMEIDTTKYSVTCIGIDPTGKTIYKISNLILKNISNYPGRTGLHNTSSTNFVIPNPSTAFIVQNLTPSSADPIAVSGSISISFEAHVTGSVSTISFFVDATIPLNDTYCDKHIRVDMDKLPSCACCDKFQKNVTQQIKNDTTLVVTMKAGPKKIKKVSAQLVYVKSITESDCPVCKDNWKQWGNFGPNVTTSLNGLPLSTAFNRELIWGDESQSPVDLSMLMSINIGLLLDPIIAGNISHVLFDCCETKIDYCIRYSFMDEDCVTCDTLICSSISWPKEKGSVINNTITNNNSLSNLKISPGSKNYTKQQSSDCLDFGSSQPCTQPDFIHGNNATISMGYDSSDHGHGCYWIATDQSGSTTITMDMSRKIFPTIGSITNGGFCLSYDVKVFDDGCTSCGSCTYPSYVHCRDNGVLSRPSWIRINCPTLSNKFAVFASNYVIDETLGWKNFVAPLCPISNEQLPSSTGPEGGLWNIYNSDYTEITTNRQATWNAILNALANGNANLEFMVEFSTGTEKVGYDNICLIPCGLCLKNCCDNFTTTVKSNISQMPALPNQYNLDATMSAGPAKITQVAISIASFSITHNDGTLDKSNCKVCVPNSSLWINFGNPANVHINGLNGPVLTMCTDAGSPNFSREIVFGSKNGPAINFNNVNIHLPLLLAPTNSSPCCNDTIRICIRYKFTDENCITCDTLICHKFVPTKPAPSSCDCGVWGKIKIISKGAKTLETSCDSRPIEINDLNPGIVHKFIPAYSCGNHFEDCAVTYKYTIQKDVKPVPVPFNESFDFAAPSRGIYKICIQAFCNNKLCGTCCMNLNVGIRTNLPAPKK
jgi:hypothetical protein